MSDDDSLGQMRGLVVHQKPISQQRISVLEKASKTQATPFHTNVPSKSHRPSSPFQVKGPTRKSKRTPAPPFNPLTFLSDQRRLPGSNEGTHRPSKAHFATMDICTREGERTSSPPVPHHHSVKESIDRLPRSNEGLRDQPSTWFIHHPSKNPFRNKGSPY